MPSCEVVAPPFRHRLAVLHASFRADGKALSDRTKKHDVADETSFRRPATDTNGQTQG
jgi:hypothetical protein